MSTGSLPPVYIEKDKIIHMLFGKLAQCNGAIQIYAQKIIFSKQFFLYFNGIEVNSDFFTLIYSGHIFEAP